MRCFFIIYYYIYIILPLGFINFLIFIFLNGFLYRLIWKNLFNINFLPMVLFMTLSLTVDSYFFLVVAHLATENSVFAFLEYFKQSGCVDCMDGGKKPPSSEGSEPSISERARRFYCSSEGKAATEETTSYLKNHPRGSVRAIGHVASAADKICRDHICTDTEKAYTEATEAMDKASDKSKKK